jgi:hypothetical protein
MVVLGPKLQRAIGSPRRVCRSGSSSWTGQMTVPGWWSTWLTARAIQKRPALADVSGAFRRLYGRSAGRRLLARRNAGGIRRFDTALSGRTPQVAIAGSAALQRVLAAQDSLSAEQVAMVRPVTWSRAGVDVVVGKAGTGKSHALAAPREAWQASGVPVLTAAVAARVAIALSETAGIRAMSVARLLTRIDRPGWRFRAAAIGAARFAFTLP